MLGGITCRSQSSSMSRPSPDRKTPVDYGVQIRFIKDLHDTGGGAPAGVRSNSKTASNNPPSKYGVAVRVQGIAGQPYVVLKEGEKGDSYGVQLKPQPREYNFPPAYNSLPRTRDEGPGPSLQYPPADGSPLRRAQSHSSLLERDSMEEFDGHLRRPPGDGRSGSYGNLDGGVGLGSERGESRSTVLSRAARKNWTGSYQSGLNGLLGRDEGQGSNQYYSREPFPDSSATSAPQQEPPQTVDTNSLAPINRLISKFDGNSGPRSQTRGYSRAREQFVLEERRYTRNLDVSENGPEISVSPSLSSATPNRYSSSPSSTASSHTSLRLSPESVAKVTALPASRPNSSQSAVLSVAKATRPITHMEGQVTPDLLIDQDQSAELSNEEEQTKQMIYNILREGNNESISATSRKVDLVFEKIQGLRSQHSSACSENLGEVWSKEKRDLERRVAELEASVLEERKKTQMGSADQTLKAELEDCLDENLQLQEQLDRKKTELHQAHSELAQLRMERETAESQVRNLEDQLAGLQEELRRESEGSGQVEVLQTDLMAVRAELVEISTVRQRQEETLRQRERELTALKGALKDEVATHDREIEALREQYSKDMEKLRSSMEQVSQSQIGIEAERQRVNATVRSLQQQLEECREEGGHWREQFQTTRDELRNTKQELLQARLEKEEFEEELKELQERLAAMKEQMPDPSHTSTLTQDLENCRSELKQAKLELEKQRIETDKKRIEILSLKKTSQERETEQKYEIDRLKEQSQKGKEDLAKALEKAKQRPDPSVVQELQEELREARGQAELLQNKLSSSERELQALREQLTAAQAELHVHKDSEQELQETSARLREKLTRLEAQLQASMSQSSEAEQALEQENRSLRTQLEDSRRKEVRLSQENEELARRLEGRELEREVLRKSNTDLEEQKRVLDRALDKANKEIGQLSSESQQQVLSLKTQLEEYRERSRKELQEAQRQGKEHMMELEHSQGSLRTLQEEVTRLKKELLACSEERDNAQLDKEMLTNRIKHLETELENQKGSHADRSREVRILEDKVKHLQMELDEEKSSAELLTDRVTRSRDQIDQLRSELMQERSSKQDLELDKNSLERQIKELKSRLADMEGQSRSSAGVSQLESKVQELEERLHSEEREKNSMLASQRRLERKLKELNITLDEERQQHSEQRDQLSLRVKALKRQVDESEGEIERLEGLRRKAIRDLEEQLELKEALQGRVTALEAELKRKIQQSQRPILDSSVLSSDDDDDDGLYDPSRITSILTESNLQTSSC
ncbi:cingulin [Arapaima gigas]